MLIDVLSIGFGKALSTDATDTSFPSKIPTGTEPTGNGVVDLSIEGNELGPNSVFLLPYATMDDDATFSMRVLGWRRVGTSRAANALWIPVPLIEVACTGCSAVGVAGKVIIATERFCDTITLVGAVGTTASHEIVSPTGNILAHVRLTTKGVQKLEFTFDSTSASAVAMNCLYAFL